MKKFEKNNFEKGFFSYYFFDELNSNTYWLIDIECFLRIYNNRYLTHCSSNYSMFTHIIVTIIISIVVIIIISHIQFISLNNMVGLIDSQVYNLRYNTLLSMFNIIITVAASLLLLSFLFFFFRSSFILFYIRSTNYQQIFIYHLPSSFKTFFFLMVDFHFWEF